MGNPSLALPRNKQIERGTFDLNIRQIETFAAVMKTGTASRAAETLGITQPAVSRSLAQLESAVGFSLFARVRNRLVPTPEAKQLYRDVESTFRGIDSLRASAARIRDRGSGEIRVATLAALGSSLVPRAVRHFQKKHQTVRVTLHVLLSRHVRDVVASEQFDLGLAADEIDLTGVTHQLFASRHALCAIPAGHPLAKKPKIVPRDLDDMPFIAYVPEDRSRQRMELILQKTGVVPRVVVETIFTSTVCSLVAEGVGIGMVHPYVTVTDARIVLRPFEPAIEIRSYLSMPTDRPKSRLVRDFIDALMVSR
jgi:DNA-binding transcriptional LysR family regulator